MFFGNGTLSFTLLLYVLELTRSPALFGIVLALAFVPLTILTPIGGVVADRINKKRIMIWLDILTVLLYSSLCNSNS